jgi:threonine synthase
MVFFPHKGVSAVQEAQMLTQEGGNVAVCAVKGNFDDCQSAVKQVFSCYAGSAPVPGVRLSSANSINIGRLVPQVAYYLHAAAKVGGSFDVVVPSGNFGNILAAYYAKQLGAPIRKFVCASNVNDVLTRFIATGTYDPGPTFTVTNSPSMDIRKSSNVERLLWAVNDGDGAAVKKLMDECFFFSA